MTSTAVEQFQSQNLLEQAKMLAGSNLVPKPFRGKPADVLVATLWGAEIGLGPVSSMQFIDVIEGSPTLNAEGTCALIRRAGHSVQIEGDAQHCTIKGRRRDSGDEQTVTWTMDMARRAGLANKAVWKSYPEAMLYSRAIKQIARSLFPDVQMGMSYAPEEVASFAAPELMDQPEVLIRGASVRPTGNGGRDSLPSQDLAPQQIDAAPEPTSAAPTDAPEPVVDVKSRTSFPPPGQKAEPAAEFTEADETLADTVEMKTLRHEFNKLDEQSLLGLADAWKAAGIKSIKNPSARLTKEQFAAALGLVLDAVEAQAEREAAADADAEFVQQALEGGDAA